MTIKGVEKQVPLHKLPQEMLRLAAVLHDSSDAIIAQDMDGKITTWNLGAEKMYGYSKAEALGMNIEHITPTVKLAEQKEYFQQLAAGEALDSFETQRIAKDGNILHVWLTVTKVLERPTGSIISTEQAIVQPVGFALLERNITERKRAEEDLRASEERYRVANEELVFQNKEKADRAAELVVANEELAFQNKEKADRAAELVVANEELAFQKEALRQSEEHYRSLVVNINDVINTLNAEGVVTYISPVIELFAGYKAEEVIGKPFINYIHPEDQQVLMESLRQALNGQVEPAEFRLLRKDGTFIYVRAVNRALAKNDQISLAGVMSDITERKRAEEDLRASEEKYRRIFNTTGTPAMTIEEDTTISLVNREFEILSGYTKEEIEGKKSWQEFYAGAKLTNMISYHHLRRIDPDSAPKQYETEFITRTGAARQVVITVSVDPGTKQIIAFILDITELKQAENALQESHARLVKTFEQTVEALVSIVEMRDPYTSSHQVKVASLACAIAAEIGTPAERIGAIRTAAMLHDIGKIFVPQEILNKPGTLNALEWSFVKTHAEASYVILKNIEFYLPIAEIVRQHHERLDGSGYPRGLSGDSILKEARILAVADVVEAMASHRPYRAALPLETALEEISSKKGLLYDAEVVDACLRLFLEKGFADQFGTNQESMH
jgi:PAS domain S-box-containing protein/putative nucleotidyltransferase with HDIG domain